MNRIAPALLVVAFAAACTPDTVSREERARWEAHASAVTITRDDWGIAHVKGATDADAVFAMLYAQAEDDFHRIEMNYLSALGRTAEADGESAIWEDLRARLFVDPDSMKALYASSPEWLRALMDASADGLNYYLDTHPEVTPKVLTRFEPWMALPFSEGSIGWDLETIRLRQLEAFYSTPATVAATSPAEVRVADAGREYQEPTGSNGFAIAPPNTANGKALLLINPHTSFFFRSEMQVTSDAGLNAYGAATWGQFFIYQGFNEKAGWMHTSSSVDQIDEYLETVSGAAGGFTYSHDGAERPVVSDTVRLSFKTDSGTRTREFITYRTHHGPVIRSSGGKWVTIKLMQEPVKALTQSFLRTKATDHASFTATMRNHTNSSNNTIFADASGNIAYFHANFVPKRDPAFDWSRPVDGSTSATEWKGIHTVEQSPDLLNPSNGWIQNTNNSPWSAAGAQSRRARDFAPYFDEGSENPRGLHAIEVLTRRNDFTLETLLAAAYDPHLIAFDDLIPPLLRAYDGLRGSDPLRAEVAEQVAMLRAWDRRWSVESVPTSLAIYWGTELWRRASSDPDAEGISLYEFVARRTTPAVKLAALKAASEKLTADFGSWRTPWGEINRFQRLTDDIVHPFDDAKPSIPVGFASAQWGSLASFGARTMRGTKKMYGTTGNSFVAVVEFGDSVRALAVTAGGQSGDTASKHFNDQAERYATGKLRPVYFYPSQLAGKVERTYRPGPK